MTLKLIGSFSIFLVAVAVAVRGGAVMRERVAQLEGFLLLLRHIRDEIACFRTPAPEILRGFREAALERAGFREAVACGDMAAALLAVRERLYLDDGEWQALTEFAAGLGHGYVSEELSRCELAISRLSAALAARREALPRTGRLFRTLLFCGTFAVILVLL